MYGHNVDFSGLTTNVLKQANFIRSPDKADTKTFLQSYSGKGGWGKRNSTATDADE